MADSRWLKADEAVGFNAMASLWDTLADLPSDHTGLHPPTAAVLVPLFEDDGGTVRVVITKRPDHMPSHPGQLAFPGGKIDPVDTSVLAAALREADEEVGIQPHQVTPLGFLEPVSTNRFDVVVAPVVGRLAGVPRLVPDPAEVASTMVPPLHPFLNEDRWRTENWSGHELWFIEVEGEVLWGASAAIMRSLLGVVRGR